MFGTGFSWKALAAMYASGLPFNIVHGISTMVFLFFLAGTDGSKIRAHQEKTMEFYKVNKFRTFRFEKQHLAVFLDLRYNRTIK